MISVIILLFFCSFLLIIGGTRKARSRKLRMLPPSPAALPIIGNLHQLGGLPHRTLSAFAKSNGPLIRFRLGSVPVFVVSSAELAESVGRTQDAVFATRPLFSTASHLVYGQRDVAFAPNGAHWRNMKKIFTVHLLNPQRVRSFHPIREQEVSLLLSILRSASEGGSEVDLSRMVTGFASNIICRVALGRKCSECDGFGVVLKETIALLGSFPVKDYIPWFGWVDEIRGLNGRIRRNAEEVDAFLEQIVDEGHSAENFVDVLRSVLAKECSSRDPKWMRDTLKALIWDLFAAGIDPISTTIEWAMAHLLANPTCLKKAQEEIRTISNSNFIVTEDEVDKMIYLKAIIKETLRLHPPEPLLIRVAQQDTKLHDYSIPAGSRMFINVWMISRDPKHWNKPEEFMPERFHEYNIGYKGYDFQFLPFGVGRRICPGIKFAILASQLMVANLLNSFLWEIPKEKKEKVLDMSESPGITLHKKFALLVIPKQCF